MYMDLFKKCWNINNNLLSKYKINMHLVEKY